MTSYEIKAALAHRHKDDFFTTEVNDGPTGTGVLRIDALAIAKSWANQCITCYEIKVSRSDFQRDNKYVCYAQYCNEMYVACPTGLIDKLELPDSIGLMYINPATKQTKIVKRAIFRKIQVDSTFLLSVIYSHLTRLTFPGVINEQKEALQLWVADKLEDKKLAGKVHSKILSRLAEPKYAEGYYAELQHKENELYTSIARKYGFWEAKKLDQFLKDHLDSIEIDKVADNWLRVRNCLDKIFKVKSED